MSEIIKRGRQWYYRFTDSHGRRVMRKGCPDRRETESMATMAEAEASKIRVGLIDPKIGTYAAHEARPLTEHLAEFHAFLTEKGSTAQHASLSRNRIARIIALARTKRISDLAPSRVQSALKAIRDGGVSLRSVHHYTRAIKAFSRWLWRDGRAREDSLAHLTSPNPDADRRHERRALTADELARLIDAAERGKVVLRVAGRERAMLYCVATGTGFRANELRSLTPESFDLDAEPPTVSVKASYSKRRRDDVQPIRPDLASTLRSWLAQNPPGSPVWGSLTRNTNVLIQRDLEAAGLAYRDASGRVADFHALRHSYITALAMSNAPVKVVQTLARHSTPSLTFGLYAHVGLYDQTAALDALPDLTAPDPTLETVEMAATGTGGPTHRKTFAPSLRPGGDGIGQELSVTVGSDAVNAVSSGPISLEHNPLEMQSLDACGRELSATVGTEGVGFEPTVGLHPLRFSRPSQSATLAPLPLRINL